MERRCRASDDGDDEDEDEASEQRVKGKKPHVLNKTRSYIYDKKHFGPGAGLCATAHLYTDYGEVEYNSQP